MIDWVKAIVPWRHGTPLNSGQIISVNPDGSIEWSTAKRLCVRGSYEQTIQLLTDTESWDPVDQLYRNLIIDGNPVKFFQGHNLWGTDDLIGLMSEVVHLLCTVLAMPILDTDWDMIINGYYKLNRVDSTVMLNLGNNADVEAALYSLERTGYMPYKGQSVMKKGTVYFGPNSRRESLKLYNKLTEINAKGHTLPPELAALPELLKWVEGKLRVENTLRAMELNDRGLALAANWNETIPQEVVLTSLAKLNMSENYTLTPKALKALPPRLVAVYHLWKEGHDMKKMYPRKTFYRYRKQLQENARIDIAVKQGNRPEPAPNVIEFRRVLSPTLVTGIPDWANGTALYFEPRANVPKPNTA
jgi:II/X family phage/plasmid replication protein